MNEHMRRYLDEDWDEQAEPETAKREDKPARKSKNLDRRQANKEWGRSLATFHKEQKKIRQKPM